VAADPNGGEMMATVGSRPVPDPTELTDRAIARLEKSMREWIESQLAIRDERLKGIDEATRLRLKEIDGVPAAIHEQVSHLELLHEEKFRSISTQFAERDTRSENEKRDSKVAVDAAFAAQKEAAAKQDEGNQKSIDKSEKATAEKIDKLAELFDTWVRAQGDKIEDLKERLATTDTRLTAGISGVMQTVGNAQSHSDGGRQRTDDVRVWVLAGFAVIGSIASLVLGIYAAVKP
jgi:cation transport regulator ChaB